jgi:hypothetical protein
MNGQTNPRRRGLAFLDDSFIELPWTCHDPVSASIRLFHPSVQDAVLPSCHSDGDNDPVITGGLNSE